MSAFTLLASNLILLGIIAGVVLYFRRRLKSLEEDNDPVVTLYIEQLQQQISHLQRDMQVLGEKIEQRSPGTPAVAMPPAATPYNQAIELIRQGCSASEVASRCGISRGEAELIISLYRNSSTS
ncbi:DUF2802 domain-containing protein [Paludibacterium paludis]|uniref:DUF2802 domain-containing protein n=1 Tax=Paludibacterium paludis TaxID=1225769 RepID=A0A918P6S9_9NEIS|nr:DUF2802 domain-containing protein [Paludibacterium paludis]GGY29655.1 hypothetical protein GCM10011289_35710 [Paludibacterium paludis]